MFYGIESLWGFTLAKQYSKESIDIAALRASELEEGLWKRVETVVRFENSSIINFFLSHILRLNALC